MADATTPRERLTELIELARTYRGWTRRKLAKSLGRDPSKLVPDSGLPKIDLVIQLAKVLDWPIQDVVGCLAEDPQDLARSHTASEESFASLNDASFTAYSEGRFEDMIDLARRAYRVAATPTERARACNREAGGWDGQGHYRRALAAQQKGLREDNADLEWLLLLRSNLANEYYTLWQLVEGRGVASDVLTHFADAPPQTIVERIANATAHYVRGNCLRRQFDPRRSDLRELARTSRQELLRAVSLYEALANDLSAPAYLGIANTCHGAAMEAEVILAETTVSEALARITAGLDSLDAKAAPLVGDWLESYSWWCIFGCNIAIRHLDGPADLQRTMAILTTKADELAESLGNWALRERVLTMDFVRRQRLQELAGTPMDWTIDSDDVRAITGTMGRFPTFHETGWEILRSAQKVRDT